MKGKTRCDWCHKHPVYVEYHDREWGLPVRDDRIHFEFLVLESAQAGLSWLTILKKREGYRRNYDLFDTRKVAGYDENRIRKMLSDPAIIRNRMKIEASINNANRFLEVSERFGSFSGYLWNFLDGKQVVNRFSSISEIPSTSPLSDKIAKDMKGNGFKFLGSTTMYAHMQATGLINDHLTGCYRYYECMDNRTI